MKIRQLWVPLTLSILSGFVVVAQVYLVRSPTTPTQREHRVLVSLHELPVGARLHPKDFAFNLVSEEDSKGYVDDQMAHLLWGRHLQMSVMRGDNLTLESVAPLKLEHIPIKNKVSIEIIREEGDL